MRTRKPISTISYNSDNYLILKLEELRSAKTISFWAFINHIPEPDESNDECRKAHKHLYIEPNKQVDTEVLKCEFFEFESKKTGESDEQYKKKKPLGVLDFRNSDFGNWYLYGLHDKAYLAYKGISRKYHYKFDDMVSNDEDQLYVNSHSIDMISLTPYKRILDAKEAGLNFAQFFRLGGIPLTQIGLYERAWFILTEFDDDEVRRGGRRNHPVLDSNNDLVNIDEKDSDVKK